jgi:hypothetical protein
MKVKNTLAYYKKVLIKKPFVLEDWPQFERFDFDLTFKMFFSLGKFFGGLYYKTFLRSQ